MEYLKKRQRNRLVLKGILCCCQKRLDRERVRQTISTAGSSSPPDAQVRLWPCLRQLIEDKGQCLSICSKQAKWSIHTQATQQENANDFVKHVPPF